MQIQVQLAVGFQRRLSLAFLGLPDLIKVTKTGNFPGRFLATEAVFAIAVPFTEKDLQPAILLDVEPNAPEVTAS